MLRSLTLMLLLLAALAPAPAAFAKTVKHAPPLPVLQEEPGHFVYLTPNSVSPTLLPPPPAPKSRASRADIQQVIQIQKYAAPGEFALARDEQKLRPEIMTVVLGSNFTRDKLPRTFALLDNLISEGKASTKVAKDFWHVPRPYVADKHVHLRINPLPPTNFSYPSGHASNSLLLARVLGDLIPAGRPILQQQASRIANRRIVAGVHTPRDVAAGQQWGQAVYLQLQMQPRYVEDFNAAREELTEAGYPLPPSGCPAMAPQKKNWKHFKSRITE